ncbi:hypothetical protein GQ53DRAFT_884487 [Thozetella sp. PMI_491]|nr:hypothetical protein GQ53DRAFT_884487 [Thozetella sp. PMI_491]
MGGSIRERTGACQALFAQCITIPARIDWFEDRQGEFNLWASGLKADIDGRASLDFRVRTRPDVRELICDLLDGLCEALETILSPKVPGLPEDITLSPQAGSSNDASPETPEEAEALPSDFSDFSSEEESDSGDAVSSDLLAEHLFNITTILDQLARLSTAIRRSGAKYRYQKADDSLKESKFEDLKTHLTVLILRESLQAEPGAVVEGEALRMAVTDPSRLTPVQKRLIHANIVRQNRILFATRNSQPLEAPETQPATQLPRLTTRVEMPSVSVEVQRSLPEDTVAPLPDDISSLKQRSVRAPSITQTATEIGSQFNVEAAVVQKGTTPSVVTRVTRTGAVQDYPSCPEPISSEYLRCPYCADLLPAAYSKNPSRWRGHVAQDILPYSCIYEDCATPDKMYLTADELVRHTHAEHSVTRWVCDYCSSQDTSAEGYVYESLEDWEQHMHQAHSGKFQPAQLSSLGKVSRLQMFEAMTCPLCAYTTDVAKPALEDHILQHLHGFALRSLPFGTGAADKDSVEARSALESSSGPAFMEDSELREDDELEFVDLEDKAALSHLYDQARENLGDEPPGSLAGRVYSQIEYRLALHVDPQRETWGAQLSRLVQVLKCMQPPTEDFREGLNLEEVEEYGEPMETLQDLLDALLEPANVPDYFPAARSEASLDASWPPPPRDPNYISVGTTLLSIEESVLFRGSGFITVLHGPPRSGKTAAAIEFVHQLREKDPEHRVLWIDAGRIGQDEGEVGRAIIAIEKIIASEDPGEERRAKSPSGAAVSRRYHSNSPNASSKIPTWTVVVDGVDYQFESIAFWRLSKCSVVITTRDHFAPAWIGDNTHFIHIEGIDGQSLINRQDWGVARFPQNIRPLPRDLANEKFSSEMLQSFLTSPSPTEDLIRYLTARKAAPVKILSFDDTTRLSGVRAQINILAKILDEMVSISSSRHAAIDTFDLIVGTGMGGMMAILVAASLTPSALIRFFDVFLHRLEGKINEDRTFRQGEETEEQFDFYQSQYFLDELEAPLQYAIETTLHPTLNGVTGATPLSSVIPDNGPMVNREKFGS